MAATFWMNVNMVRSFDVSQFPSVLFKQLNDFFAIHNIHIIHTNFVINNCNQNSPQTVNYATSIHTDQFNKPDLRGK